jgi:hypothetical protein
MICKILIDASAGIVMIVVPHNGFGVIAIEVAGRRPTARFLLGD